MKTLDLLCLSVHNILRAGTRTTLSILAICIGITSVCLISTLGTCAGESIQVELDTIGIRGVAVYTKSGDAISETALDVFAQESTLEAHMPLALCAGSARLRNVKSSVGIIGIDESLEKVFQLDLLHGTLPTASQVANGQKVVVIDADFAQKAYHRTNIVGKKLIVSLESVTEELEICAVIKSQSVGISSLLGGSLPYLIYLPCTTLTNLSAENPVNKVMILPKTDKTIEISEKLIKKLNRMTGETYQYENMNQYLEIISNISGLVTMLIGGVAGISVIVGGIGVMNAMFSSVETRIKEIGIYRALGAKRRDIVKTFLTEAMLLCYIGGMIGIILQTVLITTMAEFLSLPLTFQWGSAGLSLVMAVICGVCVGWIPAMRAANLDPIQAIREE